PPPSSRSSSLPLHDALPISFFINTDGNMNWGVGGTTSTDTNLYRSAANTLKTDDTFVAAVQSLTTGFTEGSGWNWIEMDIRKTRSEEHTSELQSRENLVCRL